MIIFVLVYTNLVESQHFRLWHNENGEGMVVWGEVHRTTKATPFTLCNSIKRPSHSSFCQCAQRFMQCYTYKKIFVTLSSFWPKVPSSVQYLKLQAKYSGNFAIFKFFACTPVFLQIFKELSRKKLKILQIGNKSARLYFPFFTLPTAGWNI